MEMLGVERIRARLHWLKRYWTEQVSGLPGVRFHTSLDSDQSVAIALMEIAGVEPQALYDHLLMRDRLRAWPIVAPRVRGLWVAPFFYTTTREFDVLVAAVRRVAQGGLR
jgi:selenocysteine lyase/cysteine desulfurase